MNGAHDLGGMHGFGPVVPEPDEPVFHAEWERRAFALTLAMGFLGRWTLDMSRHARESLPPTRYLGSSYYQIWTLGLVRLMLDAGLVTPGEVETGKVAVAPRQLDRPPPQAADVAAILARGGPSERPAAAAAAFAPGDRVRARRLNPSGHTRLPRYLRGCDGDIVACRGLHVFPDSNGHGKGEDPRHLYTVRFAARDVWGAAANPRDEILADLWEPYLERR